MRVARPLCPLSSASAATFIPAHSQNATSYSMHETEPHVSAVLAQERSVRWHYNEWALRATSRRLLLPSKLQASRQPWRCSFRQVSLLFL